MVNPHLQGAVHDWIRVEMADYEYTLNTPADVAVMRLA